MTEEDQVALSGSYHIACTLPSHSVLAWRTLVLVNPSLRMPNPMTMLPNGDRSVALCDLLVYNDAIYDTRLRILLFLRSSGHLAAGMPSHGNLIRCDSLRFWYRAGRSDDTVLHRTRQEGDVRGGVWRMAATGERSQTI